LLFTVQLRDLEAFLRYVTIVLSFLLRFVESQRQNMITGNQVNGGCSGIRSLDVGIYRQQDCRRYGLGPIGLLFT